jgi:low affinity Fe/Cu permease
MTILEKISQKSTQWTGSSWGFFLAVLSIVVWAAWGPFTSPPFSDTWQLVINTLTTLVTFLMVFLIQRSQNKDSLVIHTKLNELLACTRASNRLINIEELSEDEIRIVHDRFQLLARKALQARDPRKELSVEAVPSDQARERLAEPSDLAVAGQEARNGKQGPPPS